MPPPNSSGVPVLQAGLQGQPLHAPGTGVVTWRSPERGLLPCHRRNRSAEIKPRAPSGINGWLLAAARLPQRP